MRLILSTLFYFIIAFSKAQPRIEFFSEKNDTGIAIFATNKEFCPVSAIINFNISNLSISSGSQTVFVIPALTNRFLVAQLKKIDNYKAYKYSYKFKCNLGDITLQAYDTLYEYDLPFTRGNSFKLEQGYNGSFSHQNENALDFTMPQGTEVAAARNGVVVSVVQNNTISCPNKSCMQYNNFVTVYQPDGTFANYAHLKYKGSKVNIGDSVKQGDVIGFSGNTGFTSGPHLHFVCYLPDIEKRKTIETYFKINDGNDVYTLAEQEIYTKDY